MPEDLGKYHDDVWDIREFTGYVADMRLKYLADTELEIVLMSAINSLVKAESLLVKKAIDNPSVEQKVGDVA